MGGLVRTQYVYTYVCIIHTYRADTSHEVGIDFAVFEICREVAEPAITRGFDKLVVDPPHQDVFAR
jgi:hypothetical protein